MGPTCSPQLLPQQKPAEMIGQCCWSGAASVTHACVVMLPRERSEVVLTQTFATLTPPTN